MNFSDYTLVSFGDSYTFGESVTTSTSKDFENLADWKEYCNNRSYTSFVQKTLNFKDSHNVGIPGASNKRILKTIKEYSELNGTKNKFYMISLTNPMRDLIYSYEKSINGHKSFDFVLPSWEIQVADPNSRRSAELFKMSPDSIVDMLTYYFNDYTLFFNFAMTFYAITDYMDKIKVPYIIFDILNDSFSKLDEIYNIKSYTRIPEFFKNSDVVMDDTYYIKNFVDEIKNFKPKNYLNKFSLQKYYNINHNVDNIYTHIDVAHKDIFSPIPGDEHWNIKGHQHCAELLSDWIIKQGF